MRKILIVILLLSVVAVPVKALEFTAPEVPESGREWMPEQTDSFAEGLWSILWEALERIQPELASGAKSCVSLIAVSLLISCVKLIPGAPEKVLDLAGILSVGIILLGPSGSMIRLAADTVEELSEYGKLLFPVLTAAMAAQGGTSASASIYAGTLAFDAVLSTLISGVIVPMIYLYLCLASVSAATGQEMIGKMKDFIKWLMTWCLKIILYAFTGYMGITGVVSGTADAAALKATKLAISGMVPVVGGILSETSEAILVGAGVMKSAVGIYGLLAVIAVWVGPFLKIGTQYILLKISFGICGIFPSKSGTALIKDFSGAMGLLLAMTGTVCLLLLISVVCFMKGVS